MVNFAEAYRKKEGERFVSHRLVVKIGTQTFCEENGIVHENFVSSLAKQILDLREQGVQTVVVCSGAVALGRLRAPDISDRRVAASLGQPLLMQAWNKALYPIPAFQFLFSDADLKDEEGINEMMITSMAYGVPIVNGSGNENNDSHASKVARIIGANSLILLTNKPGVLDQQAKTVSLVRRMDDIDHLITEEHSRGGSGGMRVKASEALSFATTGGQAFIAYGHQSEVLKNIVAGRHKDITRFAQA